MGRQREPVDPLEETIRTNLVKFRDAAKLKLEEAAELSGVSIHNLRRYEDGSVRTIPATVLQRLAEIYGHEIGDFMNEKPPAPKLDERPVFFLRTLPGVAVDEDVRSKLLAEIERANTVIRSKKSRRQG